MQEKNTTPRKFRIFRFSDYDIKQTFTIFLITGFLGILITYLLKLNTTSYGSLISIAVPVASMVAYFLIAKSTVTKFLRDEQLGDSCYYMGFLFTLIALAFALINFATSEGQFSQKILSDFGIALFTTILGLGFRIYYSQFRLPAEELRQSAEDELAATVRRLKVHLDSSIDSFEKFEQNIETSIQESLKKTTISYQEYLKQASESFQEYLKQASESFSNNAQELLKSFQESTNEQFKLKEKFQSLNSELTTLNTQTTSMSQKINEFNTSLQNITNQFKEKSGSNDLIEMTENLGKFAESLNQHVEIIGEQKNRMQENLDSIHSRREDIEKEVDRAQRILKDVYTSMVNMTKFITDKIDK